MVLTFVDGNGGDGGDGVMLRRGSLSSKLVFDGMDEGDGVGGKSS